MEVVYTEKIPSTFNYQGVVGLIGDLHDLEKLGFNIEGIVYDDNWTVKRFLNGLHFKLNVRIESLFNYLELDMSYLNVKIKDLSKTNFKYVLLAYLLLNNKKLIIFDYFDVGLIYKEQKKLIKIIHNLANEGFKMIVISKDLVFLNQVVDTLLIIKNDKIIYDKSMKEIFKEDKLDIDMPEIIKFIKLAKKKSKKIDYTFDSLELLKDIYRSVDE